MPTNPTGNCRIFGWFKCRYTSFMTRYIAFIRGINGGLTLKVVDLRQLFEKLGFENVRTVLATGNVIFETAGNKKQIASRVEQEFYHAYSYKTVVILYTKQELQKLVEAEPFNGMAKTPNSSQQVSFVAKQASVPFALPYYKPEKGYTILRKMGDAICSTLDLSGKTRPDLLVILDRIFDGKVTTRNWQTIERSYQAMLHE